MTALDDAIARLRDRARTARAMEGADVGHGVYFTAAELAALLHEVAAFTHDQRAIREEAADVVTMTFEVPPAIPTAIVPVDLFNGRVREMPDGTRTLEFPLMDIERARDAIAAAIPGAAPVFAEWAARFAADTRRFDVRLGAAERYGLTTAVAAPEPECTHPNMPTDTIAGLKCDDCERVIEADGYDEVPVRECRRDTCSTTTFLATDGKNCPECNNPFTARVADIGCDECEGESGMTPVDVRVCPDCEAIVEAAS